MHSSCLHRAPSQAEKACACCEGYTSGELDGLCYLLGMSVGVSCGAHGGSGTREENELSPQGFLGISWLFWTPMEEYHWKLWKDESCSFL